MPSSLLSFMFLHVLAKLLKNPEPQKGTQNPRSGGKTLCVAALIIMIRCGNLVLEIY